MLFAQVFTKMAQLVDWFLTEDEHAPRVEPWVECEHMLAVQVHTPDVCVACSAVIKADQDAYACARCQTTRVHAACWTAPFACNHCGVMCVQ